MKTAAYKTTRPVPHFSYPNAATRYQIMHKILDSILVAVSGMGIAAILLLIIVLR